MATAFLVVHCASCAASNELEIPVGGAHVFSFRCCACAAASQLTIDTAGQPLLIAEGLADWCQDEAQGGAAPASSVPPKKRQKSALLTAPVKEVESDANRTVEAPQPKSPKVKAKMDGVKPKVVPPSPKKPSPNLKPPRQFGTVSRSTVKSKTAQEELASEGTVSVLADQEANPRKHHLRRGSAVIAKFRDGYFYSAIVEEMDAQSSFRVAWDDGDPASWVNARHVAHKHRQPVPSELHSKMAVLARWNGTVKVADEAEGEEESNVWFPAKIVRRVEPSKFELSWDDGNEKFFASCKEIRPFVSSLKVLYNEAQKAGGRLKNEAEMAASVSGSDEEGKPAEKQGRCLAFDLLRRSGRDRRDDGSKVLKDPSDPTLLRKAMDELRGCWAGKVPSGKWEVRQDVDGVSGLAVCMNFLDEREVEALRTIMGAHRAWAQYSYGETGRHGHLMSVVQRIDFGPAKMRPEGVVGGTPMWQLGEAREELLSLMVERLRHVFSAAGLWRSELPDTLQLTKIGCSQKLANHFDRRDRWMEGIATIAWSELPCEADLRGDSWTLSMERGSKREMQSVQISMPPGSAYILMGRAQGCTKHCERRSVGHNRCNCCWTHGVTLNENSLVARQSMTIRALADDEAVTSASDDEERNSTDTQPKGANI